MSLEIQPISTLNPIDSTIECVSTSINWSVESNLFLYPMAWIYIVQFIWLSRCRWQHRSNLRFFVLVLLYKNKDKKNYIPFTTIQRLRRIVHILCAHYITHSLDSLSIYSIHCGLFVFVCYFHALSLSLILSQHSFPSNFGKSPEISSNTLNIHNDYNQAPFRSHNFKCNRNVGHKCRSFFFFFF